MGAGTLRLALPRTGTGLPAVRLETAGDAGQHPTAELGREGSIPQRRCRPGASRNQRFQAGDAAVLPSSCRRCLRVSPPPRREGFGAGEMQPEDAPRSLRYAGAGPASAACACAASLPPPPAPPPPPPAAGPSSRLWRCRLPGRAAGGAAVSDSPGVMPGCRRGAGPGAARGRGSEVSGRSRGP